MLALSCSAWSWMAGREQPCDLGSCAASRQWSTRFAEHSLALVRCATAACPCPWKLYTAQQVVVVATTHEAVHFFAFTWQVSTCQRDMQG